MHFEIDSKVLQQALQVVSRAVNPRSPMPTLTGIRVEAGSGITLTATDMDLYISTTVEGIIKEPGVAVIPAKQFVSLARQVTGHVVISAKASAVCKYDGGSMALPCYDVEEFPAQHDDVVVAQVSIPEQIMSDIVNYVTPATINDTLMPHLSGVNVRVKDGELLACATDRFRVSKYVTLLDGEIECIIPSRALIEANKIGDVNVKLTNTTISFDGESTVVSSRLLARGIPIDTIVGVLDADPVAKALDVPVMGLVGALNRASITMDQDVGGVKLTLADGIVIENVSVLGEFHETIPARVDGEQEIYISPRFLKDALIGDDVDIFFSGKHSVVLVRGVGYEMGILPMRMP